MDCYFHHSFSISNFSLARAVGIPVIPRSVGPLATMLVAIKNIFIFFFSQFFKKTCLAKVDGSAQNSMGRHLSGPHRPFWGPLSGHYGFCRGYGVAGGEQVPPALLSWYCDSISMFKKFIYWKIQNVARYLPNNLCSCSEWEKYEAVHPIVSCLMDLIFFKVEHLYFSLLLIDILLES